MLGGIIKNKDSFALNSFPDYILPERRGEFEELESFLLEGRGRIVLCGETGAGKTSVARLFEKKYGQVIYVDCTTCDTDGKISSYLLARREIFMPHTGLPSRKYVEKLGKYFKNNTLILDNIEQVSILRRRRILSCETAIPSIIFIDNRGERTPIKWEERVEKVIEFKPYTHSQMKNILARRAVRGLRDGSWGDELIDYIAEKSSELRLNTGDGIELLYTAAKVAETNNKLEITFADVDIALNKVIHRKVKSLLSGLILSELGVLKAILLLSQEGEVSTGSVHAHYNLHFGTLRMRRTSGIIRELHERGIVDATVHFGGRYGNTRKVSLHPVFHCIEDPIRIIDEFTKNYLSSSRR